MGHQMLYIIFIEQIILLQIVNTPTPSLTLICNQ
jgi:hypothetical protein